MTEELVASHACPLYAEPSTPNFQTPLCEKLRKTIHESNMLTTKTRKNILNDLNCVVFTAAEQSRCMRKMKILEEIVVTEKNFIHQLEAIKTFFMEPLQTANLLSNDEFNKIFNNVEVIYGISRKIVEALCNNPKNVSTVFNKISPFLRVYSVYACGFRTRLDVLQRCRLCSPKLDKLIEQQEGRPEVHSKLAALLIAPIQRVPRLRLLFLKLNSATRNTDCDYTCIKKCTMEIENVACHINKVLEEYENMQRLLDLQRCIIGTSSDIVKPYRKLRHEGMVTQMAQDNRKVRVYLVLLSDVLIVCKMKKPMVTTHSVKIVTTLPLAKCIVTPLLDKGCMKIVCKDEEFVFYHIELSVISTWITSVVDAINIDVKNRKSFGRINSLSHTGKRRYCNMEDDTTQLKNVKKQKNENTTPITNSKHHFKDENKFNFEGDTNVCCSTPLKEINTINILEETENNKEVVVFGRHINREFTFGINNVFGVVKESVKKMFGLK